MSGGGSGRSMNLSSCRAGRGRTSHPGNSGPTPRGRVGQGEGGGWTWSMEMENVASSTSVPVLNNFVLNKLLVEHNHLCKN